MAEEGRTFPKPIPAETAERIREMLSQHKTLREIAATVGVTQATVFRYKKKFFPWARTSPEGTRPLHQASEPGEATPSNKTSSSTPKPTPRYSKTMGDAVHVVIQPKTFVMSSSLIWQAMKAAIQEWGWPGDITPEDFIDTYIYESFKQRGIILGGYTVLERTVRGRTNGYQESFNGRVDSMVSGSEDELVETDSEEVYEDEEVE